MKNYNSGKRRFETTDWKRMLYTWEYKPEQTSRYILVKLLYRKNILGTFKNNVNNLKGKDK